MSQYFNINLTSWYRLEFNFKISGTNKIAGAFMFCFIITKLFKMQRIKFKYQKLQQKMLR